VRRETIDTYAQDLGIELLELGNISFQIRELSLSDRCPVLRIEEKDYGLFPAKLAER